MLLWNGNSKAHRNNAASTIQNSTLRIENYQDSFFTVFFFLILSPVSYLLTPNSNIRYPRCPRWSKYPSSKLPHILPTNNTDNNKNPKNLYTYILSPKSGRTIFTLAVRYRSCRRPTNRNLPIRIAQPSTFLSPCILLFLYRPFGAKKEG